MFIPDNTAVNIPETKDTTAALATAIIAAVNEVIGNANAKKNGIIAGNAPKM